MICVKGRERYYLRTIYYYLRTLYYCLLTIYYYLLQVGLDTVPLSGDVTEAALARLYLDVAALAHRYD